MARDMKETGWMICSMDRARKAGQMGVYMKVSIWQARSTGGGSTGGTTGLGTRVSGLRTK